MSIPKYIDNRGYDCWLRYADYGRIPSAAEYRRFFSQIVAPAGGPVRDAAVEELTAAVHDLFAMEATVVATASKGPRLLLGTKENLGISFEENRIPDREGFTVVLLDRDTLVLVGGGEEGLLHGVFYLLRAIGCGRSPAEAQCTENSTNPLRLVLHWDNGDGTVERGYAGGSIFYKDYAITKDMRRIRDYARMLASVGINGIVINNTNVGKKETRFMTDEYLPNIARLADMFRRYGIRLYLSVDFAAPVELGELETADPLDEGVAGWWRNTTDRIYRYIPDFGGYSVKADSENRPGPFSYGRSHVDGANLLARALKPHGGILLWRSFVYDCKMDWRDRTSDRAKAAFDNFKPLDGGFEENVVLQIKNGPMDFQIREAVSTLFGGLQKTNELLELQITQEYTGQQRHVCYLVPLWKEILDFDTKIAGKCGATVAKMVDGSFYRRRLGGVAGISNVGLDEFWTGHPLAQANLYGFGRLAWNPSLSAKEITEEWVKLTLGHNRKVLYAALPLLLESREVYEDYTSPLGVGWMVTPGNHYGPSVDGYEYTNWGTYHYADSKGIGVDRTMATGTGYTGQYSPKIAARYENIETCPENLLLFFHHVPYTYVLKSGETIIQYIYNSHFEGVEKVKKMFRSWESLSGLIDESIFSRVKERFQTQLLSAVDWRDVVNTYFYRKTGIGDEKGRIIYR